MYSKTLVAFLCSFSLLGASTLSIAAPHDDGPERRNTSQNKKPQSQKSQKGKQDARPQQNRGSQQAQNRDSRSQPQKPRYQESKNYVTHSRDHGPSHRGPQPRNDWKRGDRVPTQYRGSGYYVNDWRARDLPRPPNNHRWLEVNGDYVLVAIATGLITSILIGHDHY